VDTLENTHVPWLTDWLLPLTDPFTDARKPVCTTFADGRALADVWALVSFDLSPGFYTA
jgi:hypothetical protein